MRRRKIKREHYAHAWTDITSMLAYSAKALQKSADAAYGSERRKLLHMAKNVARVYDKYLIMHGETPKRLWR